MYRYLVVLVVLAGLAGFVPDLFGTIDGDFDHSTVAKSKTRHSDGFIAQAEKPSLPEVGYLGTGRTARLEPNSEGHFIGQFTINGRRISGMVDTGATYVAMNRSTAREIGINPLPNAYKYSVSTANGMTKAAHATLADIRIGRIEVSNIDAFILPDSAMTDTLIGMSFLKKLSSYEVHNGVLGLRE